MKPSFYTFHLTFLIVVCLVAATHWHFHLFISLKLNATLCHRIDFLGFIVCPRIKCVITKMASERKVFSSCPFHTFTDDDAEADGASTSITSVSYACISLSLSRHHGMAISLSSCYCYCYILYICTTLSLLFLIQYVLRPGNRSVVT